MPRLSGTGPQWQGGLSGRGLGECAGANAMGHRSQCRQGRRSARKAQGLCQRFGLQGVARNSGCTLETLQTQISELQASFEQLSVSQRQ